MKTIILTLCTSLLYFTALPKNLTAQSQQTPVIRKNIFFGKSQAIRDVPVVLPGSSREMKEAVENPIPENIFVGSETTEKRFSSKNVQEFHGTKSLKKPNINIEGIGNVNSSWPADPNGDVGINHYIQTVNSSFAVYNKSGEILYGPVDLETIFNAFPGPWHSMGWGDPVFVYDKLADRWVFTCMSIDVLQNSYYEMVAVSVTSDPLDEYYCYAYEFENINDYPKMSVWPDGYYITYNIFGHDGDWYFKHSLVTALDRNAMLSGQPEATMVEFVVEPSSPYAQAFTPLTADFDGTLLPENQACLVLFAEYISQGFPWEVNFNVYELTPEWGSPENSFLDSVSLINVESCFPFFMWYTNAPQPGNFHDVEPINFYLMYPVTYRNFGEYEVMTACHTLHDGEKHYIRWYEFRNDSTGWYTFQSGSYMPDSASRYVPSLTLNGKGDMALVFTKSSLEVNPSIWFTGRKANDPLGYMTFKEIEIFRGLNYANNKGTSDRNRWGDYASMMVDPVDDSTFWFTSMYTKAHTSPGNWGTRIVAMNLTEADNLPEVYAGIDTTICSYNLFYTKASASNYSYLLWETDGTGSFSDKNLLKTVYNGSSADSENGQVILSLYIEGNKPGTYASDSMILHFQKSAYADAGPDASICLQESFVCQGNTVSAESYYWKTNGKGSFNDSTLLNAMYTPAAEDTLLSPISLTLFAVPQNPCTITDDDRMYLTVHSCLGINEIDEKPSLQVYPNPSDGIVTLKAEKSDVKECKILVINSAGQQIFTCTEVINGSLDKQFDFRHLPYGNYYITLSTVKGSATTQIIIH